MRVASTFMTGETTATELLLHASSFSPPSLLQPPLTDAHGEEVGRDVLPLGCGCQLMTQLLLLPPRPERGGGKGKEKSW